MKNTLKIGTRDSRLAIWQAEQVAGKLREKGISTELVLIKSEGDLDLVTPLYEMGVQGVFTRALDAALLNGRIDLAVHSMKDVPTQPAAGILLAAVLPRANHKDVLVIQDGLSPALLDEDLCLIVATSSVRRRAQWLNRYPNHQMDNLRGNIQTRLRKLSENNWFGAVFAAAALDRLELTGLNRVELDWMLPAPAQGTICVACREKDKTIREICREINDPDTELCVSIEREFLRVLMGGCSTPIAGLAIRKGGQIYFEGKVLTPDGREVEKIQCFSSLDQAAGLGKTAAGQLLKAGGARIVEQIRNAGR